MQAIGEDFLATLEKQYLNKRLIRQPSAATFPRRGRLILSVLTSFTEI